VVDELMGFGLCPPGNQPSRAESGILTGYKSNIWIHPLKILSLAEAIQQLMQIAAKHRLRFLTNFYFCPKH